MPRLSAWLCAHYKIKIIYSMLNILPAQQKKEIKLNKIFNSLQRTIIFVWILLILPAGLLISSHYILLSLNDKINNIIIPNPQEKLQNVANLSQTFNSYLKKSDSIQQSHINPVPLLDHFTKLTPVGITIRGINISLKDKTIAFSGEAQTRDQLLILENNLSNDAIFSDFSYPLSNLSEKENIKFDLTGKINL